MAGLSVAAALRSRVPEIKLHFIDPRADYHHDKSFCYFALHPHRFESAVAKRYSKIAVFDLTRSLSINVEKSPYCLVPSDQFYAAAHAVIGDATRSHSRGLPMPMKVASDKTQTMDLCFDSRPPTANISLWQVFAGGEFSVRAHGNALALDTAILMDFRIEQAGAVRFVYLLPLSADRVLVQDTWITPNAALPDFEASQTALRTHLFTHFDLALGACLRVENGAIPMRVTRACDQSSAQGIAIGARGGWLRAATGYAFLETQRGAEQLAQWVSENHDANRFDRPAPLRTRPWLSDRMDQLFLRAIQHHPERAADWFCSLFAHAPSASLVRFLGGTGSVLDHIKIAAALPLRSFLTAVV
jgi:lycopene beta-cyclase